MRDQMPFWRKLAAVAGPWLRVTKCDPLAKIRGVKKNGHNFQNIGSTINQYILIDVELMLIACG